MSQQPASSSARPAVTVASLKQEECGTRWWASFAAGGRVIGAGLVLVCGTRAQAMAAARRIAARLTSAS